MYANRPWNISDKTRVKAFINPHKQLRTHIHTKTTLKLMEVKPVLKGTWLRRISFQVYDWLKVRSDKAKRVFGFYS